MECIKTRDMRARDLRIGNWVLLDDKGQYQIDSGHDIDEIDSFPENHSYCQGLLITDAWLLSFGFEKCEGRHGTYYKHKVQELFRVWKCLPDYWGVGRKDLNSKNRDYNTHWISLNIQHVHQLQNLYFAITGDELKINP